MNMGMNKRQASLLVFIHIGDDRVHQLNLSHSQTHNVRQQVLKSVYIVHNNQTNQKLYD